jgi:hypothetical protein
MRVAYFALSIQKLHSFPAGGVSYGVVFAFFIITQGVEGRGRRRPSCRGRHAGQRWGDWRTMYVVFDVSLRDAIRRYECRSLDVGALGGRRAHEALDGAAGDGCELLVHRVTSVLWRRRHARGTNHDARRRHRATST